MEINKLIKDKNKLLMAIPIVLGILFLYVFFVRENGKELPEKEKRTTSQAFLEPQSEMADKINDKLEAYKQDKLEEQEKARILSCKTGKNDMTVPPRNVSDVCRTIRTAKSCPNTEVAGTNVYPTSWKTS